MVEVPYFLAEDAETVEIIIMDEAEEVVESFLSRGAGGEEEEEEEASPFAQFSRRPSPSARDGMNRFRWNMRLEGYTDFEGRIFWAAGNMGPAIVPGEYKVRLVVDGDVVGTTSFEIGIDPRVEGVTRADLQARFDLAVKIRDRVSDANQAVIGIREMKAQIAERLEASDDADLRREAEAFVDAISAVEGEIYQVKNQSNQDPLNFPIKLNNKLAALLGTVEGSENRPTEQSYSVFEYLEGLLTAQFDELHRILQEDMGPLNQRLETLGLEPLEVGHGG
jgi:hypothetical protein